MVSSSSSPRRPKGLNSNINSNSNKELSKHKGSSLSSLTSSTNDAFHLKCNKELNKLRSNCRKTLQQDLTRLFEEESFSDIFIEGDSFKKACHSCILITRAPEFYYHLVANFKVNPSKNSRRSEQGRNHYRVPSTIDCKQVTSFLQKVYCNEDIVSEESVIVEQLQTYISTFMMLSEPDTDKKLDKQSFEGAHSEVNNAMMKEDSLEDIKEVGRALDFKEKTFSDQDSLKPADSLELVTDSLNNVSLSSGDRDHEHDHRSTDYEDSLATGQRDRDDDRGGLTSSGSSQMVRSGTFDLLSSIPMEDQMEKASSEKEETLITVEDRASESTATLRHRIDSLDLNLNCITPSTPNKDSLDEENGEEVSNDIDAQTPVAEVPNSLTTRSQSSSLFQFFVDMDSLSNQNQNNNKPPTESQQSTSMTSSGFMFIDLNSIGEETQKSRTIERDKSKTKWVPSVDNQDKRATNQSVFAKIPPRPRLSSAQSQDDISQRRSHSKASTSKPLSSKRRTVSTSGTSTDRLHPSKARTNQKTHASPMTSMDSGMLSSLNSEGVHGDEEDWLVEVPSNSRSKPGSLWSKNEKKNDNQGRSLAACQSDFLNYSTVQQQSTSNDNSKLASEDEMLHRTLMSCSKLGEDLLQMFYSQVNSDVIINAEDRTLKAHKCILISRSPYFSAMFSGEWCDSKSSAVSLQGFSYNSVHFALCHIYSGALTIPKDEINLAELALLSNLLALDTLRDVVVYELEKNYCHFFHKPCSECVVGVVDCLIVSSECSFTQLHQKCLSWAGKHFPRLWPTRSFACLPTSLLNSCFQSTINSITPESIIETMLNCDRLTKTTPKVKWAEPIFSLIGRLIEECVNFVASNYDLIVATNAFISLGRGNSWNISALEETFLAAMNNLKPDTACKTLIKLNNIISISENEEAFGYGPYADTYVNLVRKMYRHCERYLVHNVNQVVNAPSWNMISPEVQQKIKDSAIIVFEFEKPLAPRPQLTSAQFRSMRKKKMEKFDNEQTSLKSTSSNNSKTRPHKNDKHRSHAHRSSNDHIYDEVAFESSDFSSEATFTANDPSFAESVKSQRNGPSTSRDRKSQVAKVSPFVFKSSSSAGTAISTGDIVAEIDAESYTVNECLHEAKLLEQELSRKLGKLEVTRRGNPQSTSSGRVTPHRGQTSRSRTNSSSSVSRSIASRPPFK